MKKFVPDTNLIVRLVVGDDKNQYEETIELFKKAEKGSIKIVIMPTIIAEACFVLKTYYKKTAMEIADTMEGLLSPPWLEIEHRDALRGMWGFFREGIHFVDSYLLSLERNEGYCFVSFDKKLVKKSSK